MMLIRVGVFNFAKHDVVAAIHIHANLFVYFRLNKTYNYTKEKTFGFVFCY